MEGARRVAQAAVSHIDLKNSSLKMTEQVEAAQKDAANAFSQRACCPERLEEVAHREVGWLASAEVAAAGLAS